MKLLLYKGSKCYSTESNHDSFLLYMNLLCEVNVQMQAPSSPQLSPTTVKPPVTTDHLHGIQVCDWWLS
jgi:hypothetical protein